MYFAQIAVRVSHDVVRHRPVSSDVVRSVNAALFSVSGLKDEKLMKNSQPILESFKSFCQMSSKLILIV